MKCILLYIFLARRVYDPVCCREIGINCSCTINYSFSKESSYCIKTNRIYYCFIRKIWKIEKKKYPKFILKIYKYTKNERKVWRNSYVTIWKYYFSFSFERVSIFYREISKPWPCLVLIPAKRRPSFFSFLFFRLARRGRRGETAPRDPGLVKRNKLVNSGAYGERELRRCCKRVCDAFCSMGTGRLPGRGDRGFGKARFDGSRSSHSRWKQPQHTGRDTHHTLRWIFYRTT